MRKLLVIIFLVGIVLSGFGQEVKQVQLVSSQLLRGNPSAGTLRVMKPVFSHEGATLSADSADFNQAQNTFDAFGNVMITQSNGTTVYADLLNYDGNTRLALLTNNVRLVDGTATLTTNFLTYNMGSRIGTYTGGGKIVNENDVLVSKNGYYFANSNDAYFRYDVEVTTPDALITTDTLRYNSASKIAYFYGPTDIFGKKDSTNLYTENGNYNTVTEQARFGKRNLYTQGSKSLKGDSLFYDGKAGFGRAINRITFIDTAQKIILRGNLATYLEKDESTLVTGSPYVVMTTESDSSATDSIYMTADTLYTRIIPMKEFVPVNRPEIKADSELEDPVAGEVDFEESDAEEDLAADTLSAMNQNITKPDSADATAVKGRIQSARQDTTISPSERVAQPPTVKADSSANDTIKKPSLKTDSLTRDTTTIATGITDSLTRDTTTATALKADSLANDTTRTRIVLAFHHVKLFKSDLQARADSIFFAYADSTLRCFSNPMIWAEGSQLSADTIYLQMKNQKLDNMILQQNGFIVNTELDSTKFNQVKGKLITGQFKDNKLERMYVDGNAESIYFTIEDSVYSGMNHIVSSRMRVDFSENKIKDIASIRKPEGSYYPMDAIPEDAEVLDGFIWKPKDRPRSKEEIIPSLAKQPDSKKPVPKPVTKANPEGKFKAVKKQAGKK